jgi:hypothetical protein
VDEPHAGHSTCTKGNKYIVKESWRFTFMAFFQSSISILQTLVVALGAGLGIWGVINLMEGYGNDNPGAKSQGMKQFMPNSL